MKLFTKVSILSLCVASTFFATSASAGWVFEDGTPYTEDCCKVAKVVKVKKKPQTKIVACDTCDYSKFPMAQVFPLEKGDKINPAVLRNCGK